MTALSWFQSTGPLNDCSTVPANVTLGALTDDICKGMSVGGSVCACVSVIPSFDTPSAAPTKYEMVCGSCSDPCALQFHHVHTQGEFNEGSGGSPDGI